MKILCVGGGPAGLYFSILMKRLDPSHEITVIEKNPADQTFGWGVVFSDETLGNLLEADPETHTQITRSFAHWDDIDIHFRGQVLRSRGHGFSGVARKRFLQILQERAASLGVKLRFDTEVTSESTLNGYDLVVASDGVRSAVRAFSPDVFQTDLDLRKCKYIWLGTHRTFDAFTFLFAETEHGVFQVHAYRFDEETSTFIVECNEETWRASGFDRATPEEAAQRLSTLFATELQGHELLLNKSSWINFVTVRNAAWHHGNRVLLGDAAHTAHFSIGSGTKLALEDAISLASAFQKHRSVPEALAAYENERRPMVERTQRAAQDSLLWFENVPRYLHLEPPQFAFSLLTRSLRINYENLRLRDPDFVSNVTAWFQRRCEALPPGDRERKPPRPPMFTPFRLRSLILENRVAVSPMCMYSARDGLIDDFHLVHLGARALGGPGLIFTEMTDVSPEGRISPGCAGIWTEAQARAWRRVVDFVHAQSPSRLALQLGHAGRKGSTKVPWEWTVLDTPLEPGAAWETLAPSTLPYRSTMPAPRAMDRGDMDRVREQFVRSTQLAESAGFDMLEVHAAHGYLLSSFLTPLANRREDAYGGSLENRLRFPLEVVEAVRKAWPAHKPLSVRISATDWATGGIDGDDAVKIARALAECGVDIVHVSTGETTPEQKPVFGRMWQTRFADQIRNEAHVPTIAVGNISNGDQVNSILVAGRADLVALARAHLSDPVFTQHAAAEQGYDEVFWPAPYFPAKPKQKK
jgi:anthraniloyl-CoA monooxygenase